MNRLPQAPSRPIVLLLAALLVACQPQGDTAQAGASKRTSEPAATEAGGGGLRPCELAPQPLVQAVLPEADAGSTQQAGGSLIQGIDSYQCSFVNRSGDLLTVIVHVAQGAELFKELAIGSAVRDSYRRVDIGDEGWVQSSADEVKVKAVQASCIASNSTCSPPGAAAREKRSWLSWRARWRCACRRQGGDFPPPMPNLRSASRHPSIAVGVLAGRAGILPRMDTATLTTLLLVVLLTMAVALPWLTGWRTSRAMRLASLSLWVQAAAWLVVLMLPQLPRGLGLATLQLLAGLSFVIGQHVAQHWLGPRPLIRLGPLLLLAMLPLMLVFHEPAWVHRGMGALFVLLHELLFLLAVLWPASQRQPDAWRWRSLIAVPLSVLCVLTGVRAFYGLFDPEQFPALGSGKPVAVAYLMFGSIVTLCTALAFLTAWRREAEQGLERLALTDGFDRPDQPTRLRTGGAATPGRSAAPQRASGPAVDRRRPFQEAQRPARSSGRRRGAVPVGARRPGAASAGRCLGALGWRGVRAAAAAGCRRGGARCRPICACATRCVRCRTAVNRRSITAPAWSRLRPGRTSKPCCDVPTRRSTPPRLRDGGRCGRLEFGSGAGLHRTGPCTRCSRSMRVRCN
jgi:hypothetical protein